MTGLSLHALAFLLLSALLTTVSVTEGFLFGSGGCSCGPPPCPPPPVCPPIQPAACPCYSAVRRAAVARSDKTAHSGPAAKYLAGSSPYAPYYSMDDQQPWPPRDPLELHATLSGVNLHGHQKLIAASSHLQDLELLERLGQDDERPKSAAAQYHGRSGKAKTRGVGVVQSAVVTRHPQLLGKRPTSTTTTPLPLSEKAEFERLVSSLKSEAAAVADAALEDASKCNSQVLKKLMLENMSDKSAISKRRVNEAAERKFGGSIDVICSRGHFSYVFTSSLFCEAAKGAVTCIAFRQTQQSA